MGVMLLGSLGFMRWDKYDRHEEIYLADIKSRLRQRWIYEDLRAGGSGILIENSLSPMERINGVKQPLVFAAASARNYVRRAVKGGALKQPKKETADSTRGKDAGVDDDLSDGGLEMYRDRQGEGLTSAGSEPYHHQQQRNGSQPVQLLHLDAVAEGGSIRTQERRVSLLVEGQGSPTAPLSQFYLDTAVDYIPSPVAASSLPSPSSSSPPMKPLRLYTYGKTAAEVEAVLQDTHPEAMDFSDPLHAAVLVSEFTNQVVIYPINTPSLLQ